MSVTWDRIAREAVYRAVVRALQESARSVRESHEPSVPIHHR